MQESHSLTQVIAVRYHGTSLGLPTSKWTNLLIVRAKFHSEQFFFDS